MNRSALPMAVFGLMGAALLALVFWPRLDLVVSGWFYESGQRFFLAEHPVFLALHVLAVRGAWALGGALLALALAAAMRRKAVGGVTAKGWLFALLALLIGPALIANGVFKDHWGRARPREVVEFGGASSFSPAFMPQPVATRNGSFVSGDASFGFYLPCFAYLAPLASRRKLSRPMFWGGMAAGGAFGLARIAMGAHFLSDVLFAALLMLAASAALHAALFGKESTRDYWRVWMGLEP
jgi:lipid A 4'-phosphatase